MLKETDYGPFSNLGLFVDSVHKVGYIYAWNLKSDSRWNFAVFYLAKTLHKQEFA